MHSLHDLASLYTASVLCRIVAGWTFLRPPLLWTPPMDLDSPYSISVLYQIVLEIFGKVWGGSKFAGQRGIFNVMKRREELTKMAAS